MRILMFVYNSLQHDGRVQRAADVVAEERELVVFSCNSEFKTDKYRSESIDLKSNGAIGYFKYVYTLIRYAMKNGPFDLLYAHDYYAAIPAILMLVLGISKKVIYDAHELYIPDDREESNSRRERFFRWWEAQLIKRSSVILCANSTRAKMMKDYYKLSKEPTTIQNIAYFEKHKVTSNIPNHIRELLEKDDVIRVVYQGVIDIGRQLDKIVKAAADMGDRYDFIIVGGGSDLESLRKMSGDNVHFIGLVRRDFLPEILSKCHIGIVTYPQKGYNNLYCAPNKVFEYAYVGLPMVSTENPTLREMFDRYGIGRCSDNVIDSINIVSNSLGDYKNKIHGFLLENNWENEKKKLMSLIHEFN